MARVEACATESKLTATISIVCPSGTPTKVEFIDPTFFGYLVHQGTELRDEVLLNSDL